MAASGGSGVDMGQVQDSINQSIKDQGIMTELGIKASTATTAANIAVGAAQGETSTASTMGRGLSEGTHLS